MNGLIEVNTASTSDAGVFVALSLSPLDADLFDNVAPAGALAVLLVLALVLGRRLHD